MSFTNLFFFIRNLYAKSTCTFISKLNEISFVKIQGKQIIFEHLFRCPQTTLRSLESEYYLGL